MSHLYWHRGEEVSSIKGGKRLPKGKILTELPTQHPYIRTRDINGHKIAINDLLYVPDDVFPLIKNYVVKKDDVIISIVGTIGLCAIVPTDLHLANLTENCAKIVNIDDKKLEKKFLFYYFISPDGQDEIEQRNVGSTQPKLPLYNIKEIPVPLPPLPEQEAIASVLSSLDDKIELLHRQNKTLEALSETLFRQRFVEEAQEDWEEGCLGDVIELIYGKGLKRDIRTGKGYPVIGSSGVVGYHSEFLVEGPGIVIGRKGTLGKVIYLWDNFFPIDTTYYIKSKVESDSLLYEYFLLKTLNFEEMNSDSAVPGLNRNIALST
ncbi:MAG: restriction endonuclease subunit S [Nitrospinales bacterium]